MRTLSCALLLFFFTANSSRAEETAPVEIAPELRGCWQNIDHPEAYIWFTERHCVQYEGAYPIRERGSASGGTLTLGNYKQRTLEFSIAGGVLSLKGRKGEFKLKKLERVPEALENLFKPMKLGAPGKLSDERIDAITKEIAKRHESDQAVREGKIDRDAMRKADAENEAYMVGLLQEIGWIDDARFGGWANYQAWLMMMHYCHNWPLMLAVLPEIKKEVLAGKFENTLYAGLFDRVRNVMGEPSRYGMVVEVDGVPTMGPFEDFEKADAFRKEIKMEPVAEESRKYNQQHNNIEVRIIRK